MIVDQVISASWKWISRIHCRLIPERKGFFTYNKPDIDCILVKDGQSCTQTYYS